ncbi:MAG TPA: ABC transporter permease [Chthonomonadales bacterium]|nr:ABC transporter permease [Chthonomonadales bacterium]
MRDALLLKASLRDMLRPRKLLAVAVLSVVPAIIAVVFRLAAETHVPSETYAGVASGATFGFVLVMAAVVFGTATVRQEVEQKTIVYLLTRPLPRWRVLLARYAAALVAIVVTVSLATVFLAAAAFCPSGMGAAPIGRDIGVLALGALAYGSLFLFAATLLRRPLIFGVLYAFGWETLVPQLPGAFKALSLMSYLRTLAPHQVPEPVSMELRQALGPLATFTITTGLAWTVLLSVTIGFALAAMAVFRRREYAPRDDD